MYKFGILGGLYRVKDVASVCATVQTLLGMEADLSTLAGSNIKCVVYGWSHSDVSEPVHIVCDAKFGIGVVLSSGSFLVTSNIKRLNVHYVSNGEATVLSSDKTPSCALQLNTLDMYAVQFLHVIVNRSLSSDPRLSSSTPPYKFWMTASVFGAEVASAAMSYAIDAMAAMVESAETNTSAYKKGKVDYDPCPAHIMSTLPVLDPLPIASNSSSLDMFTWLGDAHISSQNSEMDLGVFLSEDIPSIASATPPAFSAKSVSAIHTFCQGRDCAYLAALAGIVRTGFVQQDVLTDHLPKCAPGLMPHWAIAVDELTAVLSRTKLTETQLLDFLFSFLN